jgi:hypothetical protein
VVLRKALVDIRATGCKTQQLSIYTLNILLQLSIITRDINFKYVITNKGRQNKTETNKFKRRIHASLSEKKKYTRDDEVSLHDPASFSRVGNLSASWRGGV